MKFFNYMIMYKDGKIHNPKMSTFSSWKLRWKYGRGHGAPSRIFTSLFSPKTVDTSGAISRTYYPFKNFYRESHMCLNAISSRPFTRTQADIQRYPEISEIPKLSGDIRRYPEISGDTRRYPEISGDTRRYPEIPGDIGRYLGGPGGRRSGGVRGAPSSSEISEHIRR